MEFTELGIGAKTLLALSKLNYVEPTEVQEKVIPSILAGQNLIVRSQTGTGKTAAFGIGLIERLTTVKSKKALILTPTRELAVQVWKELRAIGQTHSLKIHVVYGGQSINVQMDSIRHGIDILIATPGRLLDLSRRRIVRIGEFDIAVLDEADQMLDMGFKDDVTDILNQLPQNRLTLLVSATIDESILSIASRYVPHAKTIEIGEMEVVSTIKEEYVETTDRDKFPRLVEVLRSHNGMKTLIFRETKKGAARLQERIWHRGIRAGVLQGDMSQSQRNRTLADFKEGRINVLVATNVAARGLHIDDLGLIINYDKAQSEEIHLHRVGRTGRMGAEGKAINFVMKKESHDERMSEEHPDFAWMKEGVGTHKRREEQQGNRREWHRQSDTRSNHRRYEHQGSREHQHGRTHNSEHSSEGTYHKSREHRRPGHRQHSH